PDLLDVAVERAVVDLERRGLGDIGADGGEGDRPAGQAAAERRLHLGLKSLERLGESDRGLEKLGVEGADFDEVVDAAHLCGRLAKAGNAADHAGSVSMGRASITEEKAGSA